MTSLHLLVVDRSGRARPVVVDGPDRLTVATVAVAVADAVGEEEPDPALFLGERRLEADDDLAEAGVVQGATVGVGVPVADPVQPPVGDLVVVATGGLQAGRQASLAEPGEVSIGRGADVELSLPDPEVSRAHASVRRDPDTEDVVVTDMGSHNGVGHAGVRLNGPTPVEEREPLTIGASVVETRRPVPAAPVLEPVAPDGTRRFNRPPRILPPLEPPELVMPTRPREPSKRRIPIAAALMPAVLGIGMFALIGPSPFLLFILLSPVMLASNAWSDRRHGRKEHKAQMATYEADMASVGTRLAAAVVADERMRRHAFPDPGEVVETAMGPGRRLWERRLTDDDHLVLRVGTADRPARVNVVGGDAKSTAPSPPARNVPVVVALAAAGVAGIAAELRPVRLAVARALLAQVVTLHGPRDIRIVLITAADDEGDWEWLSWTPHTEGWHEGSAPRLIATDRQQAENRLAELRSLVAHRTEARRQRFGSDVVEAPRVVLVLDGARRLRHLKGLADVLRDGPAVGVFALCLDGDDHSLPEECRATVVTDGERGTRATVRRPGLEPVSDVLIDGLDQAFADRVTRALAPLRDLGAAGDGRAELPRTVRFCEVAGIGEPTSEAVADGWAAGGRSTRALLGVGESGPFTVDLRRDGPHALIAGTTGAGKSELLQTLVASLALANRPDALSFVLVDYKGGAAFRDCARLPHCAGLITDLDGHLVDRALRSLDAELKRRERVLAAAGAKDIDDLVAGGGKLARLVIVIDEFASLVEEVPEFVTGVVGIGMRGRSLGVHVVLATQRPGGAVTADLRANVNLRLCLRVGDPQESSDVIDVTDAATIPRTLPGRALARTGAREITAFQAARVGGPRAGGPAPDLPTTAHEVSLVELGTDPLPDDPDQGAADAVGDPDDTDLAALVDAISAAAVAARVELPSAPWLAPLPGLVTADEVAANGGPPVGAPGGPLSVAVGLADLPTEQARAPFVVDLASIGNLAVVGTARSGRTTVLRTLAGGLAAGTPADALHLYGLDGGNRGLAGLGRLPHTGAVVAVDDIDRVERLVRLLAGLVDDRQRTVDDEAPTVVVLVDAFEAVVNRFAERDGGWVPDTIDRVAREGPSVGVHVVLATDRTGFSMRLASAFPARLALRQADRDDAAMLGLDPKAVPAGRAPGRGVWVEGAVEVQVAVLGGDPASAAQDAALDAIGRGGVPPTTGAGPRRVDPLPEVVALDRIPDREPSRGPSVVILGVDGDGAAVEVDLAELTPGFVVAGPPTAGRSMALVTMVRSLSGLDDGRWRAVVVTPRSSPLRDLDGPGVEVLVSSELEGRLDDALDDALEEAGEGALLVVDDAEMVPDGKITRMLEARVRTARDDGLAVVVAGTTDDLLLQRYRGWLADLRRARTGLLLSPASSIDGEVFDLKLPRSTGGTWNPGRGLLVARGRSEMVQVAVSDPALALG
ncbi:FtsK/SpoIIIE domain-containing protein [Iamia sp.]|uniref:FtsK/SpoIIIE domain-containing protein n=1 Tax=Iamia sp. TaxID=2722710 RepID=UPI002CEE0569|nr:FtsK/SpoIIIE domain-containing protein [Iamia sp.]HXH58557.1 FtsK/SpoIIIE domain-containing protein [Iamia sp.]